MIVTRSHSCSNNARPADRNGITVFEALISMILVSATVAVSVPTLRVVNLQRKSANEKLLATSTLANLGERIYAENSWNSLTTEKMALYEADLLAELKLKDPHSKIELISSDTEPLARQVRMQLSWKNPYGETADPILLSLWFYRERSSND